MHKVSALTIVALSALLSASPALAETIDTVVVTATRTAQDLTRTGSALSVISANDLAAQQTVVLADALQQTPGMTIVRYGGPGQPATIGLRGAAAGQTLIVIDGVRINDPSTVDGQALLGDLLVNNIERVEVLRGPQSTLYGSDAIGGVVNVLTKRGGPSAFAFTGSAEGGSFDTYHLNAAANGTIGHFDYGAAANYFHSNGISAADSRNGNRETDGYGNLGLTANTRYRVNPSLSFDLRATYTRAHADFDDNYLPPTYRISDSPVWQRNTLATVYAGANVMLFDGRLRNRFAYIASRSMRTTFDSPFYLPLHEDYAYRGTVQRFEYQGIVDIDPDSQLTFGAETQRNALRASTAGVLGASGHNRITGTYLQGQTTIFSQITLTGGMRYDDDQQFGSHTSVKLAAAWSPNGGRTTVRVNYGDGFKAPTLYQLYSAYSNPLATLAPETARGWEAGVDQSPWDGRIRLGVTYFDRRTKNLIDFFSCYGTTSPACALRSAVGGYYDNVGRSRARGVELSAHVAVDETLSLDATYTNMHATDALTHTDLARRPHDLASLRGQWRFADDWSIGAAAVYVGHRFDGRFNATPLSSHVTVNLLGTHALNEHIELYGRIENLFDAQYEPVAGYGAPGRAAYGGIRLRY